DASVQKIELQAVILAFQLWPSEPLNIVSDSLYVVGIVQQIERATLKFVNQEDLFRQFRTLWYLIDQRQESYYITHVQSHSNLPGDIYHGNKITDQLVAPVWTGPVPNKLSQAVLSHQFFHQSGKVLARQFQISLADAKSVVQNCPDCQQLSPIPIQAVNPRGLYALQLWQMDVTHIAEFGKLKYVHVSIDCYSLATWATAQTGEMGRHVQKHLHSTFMALGVPKQIKTVNGLGYLS
ncbi:hypothetical protein N332_08731, partial [Mesitornis unicolor]